MQFNDSAPITGVKRTKDGYLLWRHQEFVREGASWDHQTYRPHITISYDPLPTSEIEAYRGRIKLGPEVFEPINPDWAPTTE